MWIKRQTEGFKWKYKVTDQENNQDKETLLDIQKKMTEVLKIKGEIQYK